MNSLLSSMLSRHMIDRKNGHRRAVIARYKRVAEISSWPRERIREYQNERLAELLNHARRHVPHFGRLLGDANEITVANVRDVLASLPVMTRADIQAEPGAFVSDLAGDAADDATGGSTGTPMRFKVDATTQISREASLYWSDHLAGWDYGDRIAMLWGSDKDVKTSTQKFRSDVRWWIDNRRWYNAFNMGEDQMAGFHRAMTRFRPHIMVAYAGSLDVYARYVSEHVPPARRTSYPITSIISSAEMLMPQTRALAERVFGVPVFNRYGNREFGAIAAECSAHDGLHVNEADFVVEIGPTGSLLVTYLHNKAMPFIRYDTGDLAGWHEAGSGPCRCGLAAGRLDALRGRMADTIRTAHGKLIHGEYFTHLLYSAQHVREFQFVQETPSRYTLLLAADGRESAELEAHWRSDILEEVGSDATVTIEYVDHIPVLASGKRKFTLSRCGEAYDQNV